MPRCIVLDIDDTDDAVHGQQQLALFNTHAGGYCFQPIKIFEATTGRPVLSLLRALASGHRARRSSKSCIHVIGRIPSQLARGRDHCA